jgi:hypothetical protein
MRTGCAGIENQRSDWPQQLDAVKAITTRQQIMNSHNKAKQGRQKINNTIGLDRKVDRKSTLRKKRNSNKSDKISATKGHCNKKTKRAATW